MGASPSSLALGALGALFAAQAGVAAFAPQAFASLLGAPAPSPAMSRMLAACFATFGVLFAVRRPRAARGARGKRADGARHSLRLGVSTSTRWQPSLTVHCSGFCPRVDGIIYCQHGCASIVNTAAPDALHGTLCSGPPPQHFIPYSDKHQGGLRTAQMLSFLLALAGATDGFFAPDASPDAQAAGRRVAVLHAAATALATYAVRFAEKRKSAD